MTRRIRNQKGMTLIEIMLVIVLLGGVLGYIGKTVWDTFGRANFKSAKLVMQEIGKSLQMYKQDCGSYPSSLEALQSNTESCEGWGPDPYMKKIPKYPWQKEFDYSGESNSFTLKSFGGDGEEGGEGKNADIEYEGD